MTLLDERLERVRRAMVAELERQRIGQVVVRQDDGVQKRGQHRLFASGAADVTFRLAQDP